jgi:hypothetical protein
VRALITSFNQKLGLNPMVSRLLHAIPGFEPAGVHDCDVVFLSFIAPEQDFVPDKMTLDAISRRKLPVIIFDHSETFKEPFILGFSPVEPGGQYELVHSILARELNTKAYFKREMSPTPPSPFNLIFPVYPLDWTLNALSPAHVDTREEYNARPIDIFYSWGYSNESRPRLMGELLRQAGRFCAHFCLTEEDLDVALKEGRERIFALLFTPHFRRIHYSKIFEWQGKAKVSISMFGAGKKCFRCAEASYNAVMAQQAPDELQWSYPWVAGRNCIQLPTGRRLDKDSFWREEEEVAVAWLYSGLRETQGSLYDIYLKGMENNQRYHNATYARDYLAPRIMEALK